jgi:hypothetical protein
MGSGYRSTVDAWSRFLRVPAFRRPRPPESQGGQTATVYGGSGGWGVDGKQPSDGSPAILLGRYVSPAFPGRFLSVFDPRVLLPSEISPGLLEPFRTPADGTAQDPVRWRSLEEVDLSLFRIARAGGAHSVTFAAAPQFSDDTFQIAPSFLVTRPRGSLGVAMFGRLSERNILDPPFIFFGSDRLKRNLDWTLPQFRFTTRAFLNQITACNSIWYVAENGTPTLLGLMVMPDAGSGGGIFRVTHYVQRDTEGAMYATSLTGKSVNLAGLATSFFTNCLSVPVSTEAVSGHIVGTTLFQSVEHLYGGFADNDPSAMLAADAVMDIGEMVVSPHIQDAMPVISALQKHAAFEAPVFRRLYGDSPISFPFSGASVSPDLRSFRIPDGTPSEILATGDMRLVRLRTYAAIEGNNAPMGEEQIVLPWSPPQHDKAVAFNGTVIRGLRVEFIPWSVASTVTHGLSGGCDDLILSPPYPGGPPSKLQQPCWQEVQGNSEFHEVEALAGYAINQSALSAPVIGGRAFDCGPSDLLPAGVFRYAGLGPRNELTHSKNNADFTNDCPAPPPPTPTEPPPVLPPPPQVYGRCQYPDGGQSQFGGAGQCLVVTQDQCTGSGVWTEGVDCFGNPLPPPPAPGTPTWPPGACKLPRGGTGGESQFGGAGDVPVVSCTGDFICQQLSEAGCAAVGGQWFGPWSGCYETGIYGDWEQINQTLAYEFDFRTDHVEILAQLGASIYSPDPDVRPNVEHFVDASVLPDLRSILTLDISVRAIATRLITKRRDGVIEGPFIDPTWQTGNAGQSGTIAEGCQTILLGNAPLLQERAMIAFSPEQTQSLLDGNVVTPTRWNDDSPENRSLPVLFYPTTWLSGPSPVNPLTSYYAIGIQLLFESPSSGTLGPHVAYECNPNPFP